MGQKKFNDKKYDRRRRHDKQDQKNTSSARETKKARGPELKTKSSDIYKCLLKWQTLMNFLLLLTILSRHLSGSPRNRHQAGPTNSTYRLSKGAGGSSQDIRSTRFDIYKWWVLPFQNGKFHGIPFCFHHTTSGTRKMECFSDFNILLSKGEPRGWSKDVRIKCFNTYKWWFLPYQNGKSQCNLVCFHLTRFATESYITNPTSPTRPR